MALVGGRWIVTVDELAELRRANPVRVDDVAPLVAAQRAAIAEMIGKTQEQSSGSAAQTEPIVRLVTRSSGPVRFGLIGVAAATIVVLALPVVFLTTASRGGDTKIDDIETDNPSVDQLPEPDDPELPEGRPDPNGTDRVTEESVPPSSSVDQRENPAAKVSPSSPETTSPPVTTPAPTAPSPTPVGTWPPAPAATAAPVDDIAPTTTTTTAPATVGSPGGSAPGNTGLPFDPTVDLLMITLDFANRDDGHAAVASRELATSFGLDPLVVAGTQDVSSSRYVQEYGTVMAAAWGSGWLDAATDRAGAVATAADRWLQTVDSGGVVRVAEGGVSDFTADVVREVRRRRPALETAAVIQVVHHNQNNEDSTRPGDLELVRTSTAYVRIDDGNSANDTADLNAPSSAFVSAALSGRHADAWSVAFEYLAPESLDFSDTVTALHVLGVGVDEVAEPGDFATRFIR